ncbi:hypothetical protein L3X38_018615 [Prunus dulcis]|uniref:Uncharacterized protein n=1 Tax=Prunus dulcis TaxID=3755 RepID=A0AAD4WAB9_PRUDU|nr:hypothetical protein L3X38_018615 [Prunus dulcis]
MFYCSKYIWTFEVFPTLDAQHFVVHEENDDIPHIRQWRSNTSAHFHKLISQVFENYEVDKQQPYWNWGDNDENAEEIVELFANKDQENTSTFVEEKDDGVEETATLPSSSKGKLLSTELCTLKREFQTTKDELAKVASSNRVLRKRVCDLKEMVQKESLKHEKECQKKLKRHEEVGSPRINEGDDNDMSTLHEYITPTTETVEMKEKVPDDGAESFVAMQVQETKMGTLVSDKQVQQEAEKLPTLEDVDGYGVICKKLLSLLEDWKKSDIKPLGGQMNPPIITNVTVAGDKRLRKKAAAPNTVDLQTNYLKNILHFVHSTWQHSDTMARVLYYMHFYDASEVEEVMTNGLKMSKFTPFTIRSIGDVPQQCDG